MKNLFQNKKILFTLILMVSCFGILGMGGMGKAASCTSDFCAIGDPDNCYSGHNWCLYTGVDKFPISYEVCLKNSAEKYIIKCDKDGNCNPIFNTSCNNQCCKDWKKSNNYECKGVICQAVSTDCESVSGQVCCDMSVNNCPKVVTSGPKHCSSGTCCQPGNCVPKTTVGCTDGKCNYSTKKYCDGGTWSSSKYCSNCPNHCGDGDCNCGETITSCADCGTTPTPCYWINIGCNLNDECDNQEAEICGPSNCKGNCDGKSRGSTRCVSGSDCNENSGGGNSGGSGGYTPDTNGGAVRFTNPLSTESFEALIMGIINWILGIVVSLAILFLIIGGLMYITSAGDEERIKKAKNIILYAIVGLGVVILSWSIITELKDILGVK